MSANDELDWVRREIDWLAVPLSEDKPLLGVCLGAQMLARQLGARVFTYPDKRSEIGYYPLAPTPDADLLCAAPFPRCVYHWHCDGFELPRGARLLALSDGEFPNQAFAFGSRALALQFHPEVTYAMICRWTTRGAERLQRPGAQPRPEQLEGWFRYDRAVALWLEAMLPAWLDGALAAAKRARRRRLSARRAAGAPRRRSKSGRVSRPLRRADGRPPPCPAATLRTATPGRPWPRAACRVLRGARSRGRRRSRRFRRRRILCAALGRGATAAARSSGAPVASRTSAKPRASTLV